LIKPEDIQGRPLLDQLIKGLTDSEQMSLVAEEYGVPQEQILRENKSKHTKQGVEMTLELLALKGINPRNVMSVHMPSAERRNYGTWKAVAPELEVVIASPRVPYEQYHERGFQGQFDRRRIITTLVGNIHRAILIYPGKGDMIKQLITREARDAYHELIEIGYVDELERNNLDNYIIPDELVGDDREFLSK